MNRYQKKQIIIVVICVIGSLASLGYILSTGSFGLSVSRAADRNATAGSNTNTTTYPLTVALGQTVPVGDIGMTVTLQQLEVIPCRNEGDTNTAPTNSCPVRQGRVMFAVQSASIAAPNAEAGAPVPPEQIVFSTVPSAVRGRTHLYRLLDVQHNQARIIVESL